LDSLSVIYPVLATIAAYLLGSLSFAVIVSRVMGLNDPRTYGSKNPGATNVLRSGSKQAAVVTLLLDAAKGWLPVVLVRWYGQPYGLETGTVALVGLGAFVGHLYPVFFRFEGGKGVATAAGVLAGPALGAGAGDARDLDPDRGLLPLFLTGLPGGGGVCADLLRLRCRSGLVHGRPGAVRGLCDVAAADLPPRGKHWPSGARYRIQAGQEEELSGDALRASGLRGRRAAGSGGGLGAAAPPITDCP